LLARVNPAGRRIFRRGGHSRTGWTLGALATLATVVALILLLLLAATAGASPDIRSKRAQAQLVLEQVRALGAEVGAAAERWNGARLRLGTLEAELRAARTDLRRAREEFSVAERHAGERLVALYTGGAQASALEVVLGAQSLDEMVDGLETGARLAEQDAAIVAQVRQYGKRVAERERRLATARAEQAATVAQLARERAAIEARLAERERLLATVQEEVRRLEAAERARQAELERRARAELARQRREAAARQRPEAAARQSRPAGEPASAPAPTEQEPVEKAPPPSSTPRAQPPPADASRGAQVVAIAMRYLGVPYRWGGASPSTGFDCSGFTMYVYAQIGVSLPHYAAAQYRMGVAVSRDQLEQGDLVFFRGLGHMGMYIGGGNFIHAPQTGDVVKISSLNEPYRVASWVGARRIL
jgi:cell wall-associated NlpC family hydrolase